MQDNKKGIFRNILPIHLLKERVVTYEKTNLFYVFGKKKITSFASDITFQYRCSEEMEAL